MSPWVRLSQWLHRYLARSFPHEFQVLHGAELEQMGDDAIPYIWQHYGLFGIVRLIGAAFAGLLAEYLTEFRQDLRYAARRLCDSAGFTAIGILSLALSIGMSGIFLIRMADWTKPAKGIHNPGSLVATEKLVPYPYFEEYRNERELFSSAAAFIGPTPFTVGAPRDGAKNEHISGHIVSLDYFVALEAIPAEGRFFDPTVDGPGSIPTVVVSDRFWRNKLQSDPGSVGSTLLINGRETTIIGIAPKGFLGAFPRTPAEIFLPVSLDPIGAPELRNDILHDPNADRFRVLLRLADGVTVQQAQAAIQVITNTLDQQKPEPERPREDRSMNLLPGGISMLLPVVARRLMWGANGILLSIVVGMACANLAVLMLARSSERRKEVAIRLSVGASRFRIVRQLLTESVLLALAGGAASLVYIQWQLSKMDSLQLPLSTSIDFSLGGLDVSAILLVLTIAVIAGIVLGAIPALAAVRGDLASSLKEGVRPQLRVYSRFGIRNLFMFVQLSSSLVLVLFTCSTVARYEQRQPSDPGFETDNLYLVGLDPIRDGYTLEQASDLLDRLDQRLGNLSEISAAALALDLPFSQPFVIPSSRLSIADRQGQQVIRNVARQRIGAGYFRALGVPLVRGREFQTQDHHNVAADRETPILLNQTAVERLFGGEDPFGQVIREGERNYTVVGVVGDISAGLLFSTVVPTMFVPLSAEDLTQGGASPSVVFRGRPGSQALEAAEREMTTFSPALSLFDAHSFGRDGDQINEMMRQGTVINACIAVFGVLLSVIGLFSVTTHAVARRRKEIGVRVALGARRDQILRLVLKEGVVLVAVASVLGFSVAFGVRRILTAITSQLGDAFSAGPSDPLLTIVVPIAWAALALFACYLPARRAMRIDPALTLKAD